MNPTINQQLVQAYQAQLRAEAALARLAATAKAARHGSPVNAPSTTRRLLSVFTGLIGAAAH